MRLTELEAQELLIVFTYLKKPTKRRKSYGICLNVERLVYLLGHLSAEITTLRYLRWIEIKSRKWPKYSGNSLFPVPPGSNKCGPGEAYYQAAQDKSIWDGRYGRLRIQLLNFLIRELKKEIKT